MFDKYGLRKKYCRHKHEQINDVWFYISSDLSIRLISKNNIYLTLMDLLADVCNLFYCSGNGSHFKIC